VRAKHTARTESPARALAELAFAGPIPLALLGALALASCYADPPLPAVPSELSGCHPGAYGARSALRCAEDADCVLCRRADAPCGRLTSRAELALTNDACPAIDERACDGAQPACCAGFCVQSLGAPGL
jgi:hypothetical protein